LVFSPFLSFDDIDVAAAGGASDLDDLLKEKGVDVEVVLLLPVLPPKWGARPTETSPSPSKQYGLGLGI
jgi:hypothetical protein